MEENMEENMEERVEVQINERVEDQMKERVEDMTEEPATESLTDSSGHLDDQEEEEDDSRLEILQLQGLVVQLREGLHGALAELAELRHRTQGQEEALEAQLGEVHRQISGLRSALNTCQEELGGAVLLVEEVSGRQKEAQKKMELLRPHPAQRKRSEGDLRLGACQSSLTSQPELSIVQHYLSSLTNHNHSHRSPAPAQTCEEAGSERGWPEEMPPPSPESSGRQRASLELLESERLYVSSLSLLLKANISFNGSDAPLSKDKRVFPSSLRFLIQQHLDLLHALQERVLRCQWQGIMGDVFLKLTGKESDFLGLYVSYLKELPDCLALVSTLPSDPWTSAALLECDVTGDETRPSLRALLMRPAQRIPQYTLLLQGLLRQTEVDHPDYYLILVSIQQFRTFTSQYQDLLASIRSSSKQRSAECGIPTNPIGSMSPHSNSMIDHVTQVKRSKQRLLEQIQSRSRTSYQDYQDFQECRREQESQRYHKPPPHAALPYFSPDPEPHRPAKPSWSPSQHGLTRARDPSPGLRSIPESRDGSEASFPRRLGSRGPACQGVAGSALAQALGEFLLPGETAEADEDSLLEGCGPLDRCSSGSASSSDSSIDIAFVRCPRATAAPRHRAPAAGVPRAREAPGGARPGCASPDEAVLMRHGGHRPLQAGQRKSKSLNGLQLDSTVGADPSPDRALRGALERTGSSTGGSAPPRRGPLSLGGSPHYLDPEKHMQTPKDPVGQTWGEEPKWRGGGEELSHTPLSERSRKQEKGGFRTSFKRLFKKKSAEERRERSDAAEATNQSAGALEAVRGTAV